MRFWDINTGKIEKTVASTSAIHSLDLSGSDSVLITGHKTGDIRIWSSTQMKQMTTIDNVHHDKVVCCKFSRNGKQIISMGRDHLIKITDFSTYKEVATIENPDLMIPQTDCSFGLSSNGKYMAVGAQDGSVFVFDMVTYQLEEIFSGEHTAPVVGCSYDPSALSRLATIDATGNLMIWE